MAEQFKVWKGTYEKIPATASRVPGHVYHCTDTRTTYLVQADKNLAIFSTTVTKPSDIGALNKSGDTLGGPLTITGGDAAGAGKLILDQNTLGQITDSGTSTLLGFINKTTLTAGHSSYTLALRGSATRPTYNTKALALYSDVETVQTNLTNHIKDAVTISGTQTITGTKTFNAPTNINQQEQTTIKLKTANGGAIIFGKEGANSGTMIRLDQTDGICRLRFRSSATAGAMVWEQPEQGAQLYIDLGKEGVDKRRITFPTSAGTLALTSNISSSIAAAISGGTNYIPKFTGANKVGNSNITDDGSTITLGSKVVIKGNGGSYNEGLRILPASNGWSNVFFSADNTVQGAHDGGWLIGRRGAVGSIAGAIGDFTIEEEESNGSNLTIHKNGGGATLQGSLSVKGAISATGIITTPQGIRISQSDGTTGYGISLYGSAAPQTYGLWFGKTSAFGTHGTVTSDWATYFGMNSGATTRGWIFRREDGCVASISGAGNLTLNGNATIGNKVTFVYDNANECVNFTFI